MNRLTAFMWGLPVGAVLLLVSDSVLQGNEDARWASALVGSLVAFWSACGAIGGWAWALHRGTKQMLRENAEFKAQYDPLMAEVIDLREKWEAAHKLRMHQP